MLVSRADPPKNGVIVKNDTYMNIIITSKIYKR